jgi:transcriptional repressor NrdR
MQCRTNGYRQGVQCPICHADDTKVVDSRVAEDATAIRRRRECLTCAHRFTTFERVDHAQLTVVKSHGGREPFDRKKVVSGLLAATTGRSVAPEQLEALACRVEESARLQGSEVSSANVGLAVLEELRTLDEVAYLRFASVYKDFDAASDFHRELELLQKSALTTPHP